MVLDQMVHCMGKNLIIGHFPSGSVVKNPSAMPETPVQFLAWKIPRRQEQLHTPDFWPVEFHGLYSPLGFKELDTTEDFHFHGKNKLDPHHKTKYESNCTLKFKGIK